jgi:hypothetical protein
MSGRTLGLIVGVKDDRLDLGTAEVDPASQRSV